MRVTSEPRESEDLHENSSDEEAHRNNQSSYWLKEKMSMEEERYIQRLSQTVKQKLSDQSSNKK